MKKILTMIALVVAGAISANAATILTWNPLDQTITGSTINPLVGTTIDPNLETGSGLNTLTAVGLQAASITNGFGGNSWNLTNTLNQTTDYISFSVSSSTGYDLTLSSIAFSINASASGPGTGVWGYSINGGSFVLATPISITTATQNLTYDFSDFTVGAADTVEFRFWAYGTVAAGGGASGAAGTVRMVDAGNRITLDGTLTAVPEPSSMALLGVAAVAALSMKRRRTQLLS